MCRNCLVSLSTQKRSTMKYKIFIITFLLGWVISCEKEISPIQSEKFIKFYGDYMMDEAGDVAVLKDGGFAICGTGTVSGGGKRGMLIVTDEYGNIKPGFPKYYTEEGYDSGINALLVKDGGSGGFLLFGYVDQPAEGTAGLQKDMFLVRTSGSGEELWHQSYGSDENEVILHATERTSSGYMLAGYTEKEGNTDILLVGVTPEQDTNMLKLNRINPDFTSSSASFIRKFNDRYLCVCTLDKTNRTGTEILILNVDDNLGALPLTLSGSFVETGKCIIEDGADKYLILGNRINGSGKSEVVVYRVEIAGQYISSPNLVTNISVANTDMVAERLVKTADGGFAIVGTRQVGSTNDIFLQFLSSDYSAGNLIAYGAIGNQSGTDIDLPEDGGIVLLGTTGDDNSSMISLIKTGEAGDL